ncbi:hypothetical protein GCM10027044_03960 [Hymenobacter ruber]
MAGFVAGPALQPVGLQFGRSVLGSRCAGIGPKYTEQAHSLLAPNINFTSQAIAGGPHDVAGAKVSLGLRWMRCYH